MAAKKGSNTTVLSEAEGLIFGDREDDYGTPKENLTTIADFWNVYIRARVNEVGEVNLGPKDVAYLMGLLKLARLIKKQDHRDSQVDYAGYIGLAERVDE